VAQNTFCPSIASGCLLRAAVASRGPWGRRAANRAPEPKRPALSAATGPVALSARVVCLRLANQVVDRSGQLGYQAFRAVVAAVNKTNSAGLVEHKQGREPAVT
jgi:hypothetical protein